MFYVTYLSRFSSDLGVQDTAGNTMSVQVLMNIALILKRCEFKTYLSHAVEGEGSNTFYKGHEDCFSVKEPEMILKYKVQISFPDIGCGTAHTESVPCSGSQFSTLSLIIVTNYVPR